MVSFTTTLEQLNYNIWSYHLPVPPEITAQFVDGNNRRVKVTLNNKITISSSLMPLDKGSYILVNKQLRKQLKLEEGESVNLQLEKDNSEYGMPVPESFSVLLDQDEEASNYFHKLTPGKQRSLLYIVGKVKNIDSQLNKGMAILDHLKEFKGEIEPKTLNNKIKEYNQRGKLK